MIVALIFQVNVRYNMKKLFLAVVAALAIGISLIGCDKKSVQKVEINMTVENLSDSSAVIRCEYNPEKSLTYMLMIGEYVSQNFSQSKKMSISNLVPGTKYDVVAVTYDGSYNEVETIVVSFTTTGAAGNAETEPEIVVENW